MPMPLKGVVLANHGDNFQPPQFGPI